MILKSLENMLQCKKIFGTIIRNSEEFNMFKSVGVTGVELVGAGGTSKLDFEVKKARRQAK